MKAPPDTTNDQIVSPLRSLQPSSGTITPVKKGATMAPDVVA